MRLIGQIPVVVLSRGPHGDSNVWVRGSGQGAAEQRAAALQVQRAADDAGAQAVSEQSHPHLGIHSRQEAGEIVGVHIGARGLRAHVVRGPRTWSLGQDQMTNRAGGRSSYLPTNSK